MWYEPPAEDADSELDPKTQSSLLVQATASPRLHVWCAPWPVAKGGPTLYHATKCVVCDAPGLRVNRSGKTKKGRSLPQPWCPKECPGAPRDWELVRKQHQDHDIDSEQTDDAIADETAETAHTLMLLLQGTVGSSGALERVLK